MTLIKKQSIVCLLIALIGFQLLITAHSIDHAVEHHDQECSLHLAIQKNGHATIAATSTLLAVIPDVFDHFLITNPFNPVFHFNFYGRAPPTHSLA